MKASNRRCNELSRGMSLARVGLLGRQEGNESVMTGFRLDTLLITGVSSESRSVTAKDKSRRWIWNKPSRVMSFARVAAMDVQSKKLKV